MNCNWTDHYPKRVQAEVDVLEQRTIVPANYNVAIRMKDVLNFGGLHRMILSVGSHLQKLGLQKGDHDYG
jgi:hypothetical protein